MKDWFEEAFGGFAEMSLGALIFLLAVIAVGVVCLIVYLRFRKNKKDGTLSKSQWTTKELTTAALCVGGAFVLSFIKIFSMPMGGSITPASMLPIMAFAYIYGVKKGLLVGFVYSMLQLIQDPVILFLPQVLLDYTLSFGLLGLAGFAKKSILPGIAYGCAARFLCQFLSGIIFFAMYAPEGMPVWLYSLAYSGSIVGIECAICMAVATIPAMSKMLNRAKAQNVARMASAAQEVVTQKTA